MPPSYRAAAKPRIGGSNRLPDRRSDAARRAINQGGWIREKRREGGVGPLEIADGRECSASDSRFTLVRLSSLPPRWQGFHGSSPKDGGREGVCPRIWEECRRWHRGCRKWSYGGRPSGVPEVGALIRTTSDGYGESAARCSESSPSATGRSAFVRMTEYETFASHLASRRLQERPFGIPSHFESARPRSVFFRCPLCRSGLAARSRRVLALLPRLSPAL